MIPTSSSTGAASKGATPSIPATSAEPDTASRTHWLWGAASGLVAAGAALGTGELLSGFSRRIPSLLVAIFDVLVDYSPTGVVRWSRETFGSNQKSVTIIGITLVTLTLGAVVGILARRHRRAGAATFATFGAVGGWAAARTPLSSAGWGWFTALAAAATGMVVFNTLTARAPVQTVAGADSGPGLLATPDRRLFFGLAGGAAFWAIVGSGLGRMLRNRDTVDRARDRVAASLVDDDPGGDILRAVVQSENFDTTEGIASIVTSNDDFYRIDTAFSPPQVDPADWSLTIKGMVDNELRFSFDELLAMEQIEEVVTLSCVSNDVGGHLVGNAVWTGVPLASLLEAAGVHENATQIVGRSVDDWTGGFPTEIAFDGRPAMVALTMNGEPLPIEHGFPARLVVPGLYGYVSATKWLKEIELTTWDGFDGYWINRGWSKEGPIKTQSRIDVPNRNERLAAGANAVAGVAWAPGRSIAAVEVRIDDGEWVEATLSSDVSDNAWRQWLLRWDATPGNHIITVRATDGEGNTQAEERRAPAPNGATGYHSINVMVR